MRIGLIFKNNLGLSINIFSVKSLQFTHELSICINVLCSKNLNEFATQWLKLWTHLKYKEEAYVLETLPQVVGIF